MVRKKTASLVCAAVLLLSSVSALFGEAHTCGSMPVCVCSYGDSTGAEQASDGGQEQYHGQHESGDQILERHAVHTFEPGSYGNPREHECLFCTSLQAIRLGKDKLAAPLAGKNPLLTAGCLPDAASFTALVTARALFIPLIERNPAFENKTLPLLC